MLHTWCTFSYATVNRLPLREQKRAPKLSIKAELRSPFYDLFHTEAANHVISFRSFFRG